MFVTPTHSPGTEVRYYGTELVLDIRDVIDDRFSHPRAWRGELNDSGDVSGIVARK